MTLTLANKLTVSRIIMIPFMLVVLYIPAFQQQQVVWELSLSAFIFAILFVIAGFTDYLDGLVARKTNTITVFGQFLDPIADKALVLTAMSYLVFLNIMPVWMIVLVLVREFTVSGLRLIAVQEGHVISASNLGKIKTAWTMFALTFLLFNGYVWHAFIAQIFLWLLVLITLASGLEYVIKYRKIILKNK